MKNYLLPLLALLAAACGAYLGANSISGKERLELLNGAYELVDWQILPTPANRADSIVVPDVPRRGERITLQTNGKGDFQIAAASSLPLLQQTAGLEWHPAYTLRTWFGLRHRVVGQYHAGEQSATVYWHRAFVN